MSAPLWTPSPERIARALLTFSVLCPDAFWLTVWEFCGIVGDMGERVVTGLDRMPGAKFFPNAKLNFTENILRRRDGRIAMIASGEGKDDRALTWADLSQAVERFAGALLAAGIRPG